MKGSVYVKIFRLPGDGSTPTDGYDVVDQFFAVHDVSLNAHEILPLSFEWDIPAHLPSGDYQAAFFFSSARKFNLLGLPFTDDVVGNTAEFSVAGERENVPGFDKAQVTVAGDPYYFAAFTPKVDREAPIPITAILKNPTAQALDIPITWTLYKWDQQDSANKIREDTQVVSVSASGSQEVSYEVSDTSSSVYVAIATARFQDTKSILNVRFTRTDVPTMRINFPGVTKYPLNPGEENTLFSCLHSSGTMELIEGGRLELVLKDLEGNEIHSHTYEGGVTGAMMGVKSDFTPTRTYRDFTLEARLYRGTELVDRASMRYDCALLGRDDCNAPIEESRSLPLGTGAAVGGALLALVLLLGGAAVYQKYAARKDDGDTPESDTTNTNA